MSPFALGAAAALPPMLLLWYVHSRDKDPEPRGLLWRTFFWGVALCVPVIPVAFGVHELAVRWGWRMQTWDMALLLAFLGIALPEQCFRLLVLRLYVWNKPAFDEPLDGVVYGATVSLGFATLENLFYVIVLSDEVGPGLAMLRAVTSIPQQAFIGIILGAFVGRARFEEDRANGTWRLASGFAATTLLQGAYYTLLFLGSFPLLPLTLLVLLLEVRWGRRLYKELQAEQRSTNPSVTDAPSLPQPSTLSARLRRFVGGMGLWCCGLLWMVVLGLIFDTSRPWDADASDRNGFAASLATVFTIISLVVRRSGQRDLA
ncbi:PrsW family intramembrane metalloprotease [Cystobacter fuscus]|uniref:PrsW family intramembrane metalloprotease n=1 Tax=Cystobacter fuscus TaxID=43 RepID=UPI002B2BA174|nr:PrsW family intramembrane metalloprotease [Cystobacter fuscus]